MCTMQMSQCILTLSVVIVRLAKEHRNQFIVAKH